VRRQTNQHTRRTASGIAALLLVAQAARADELELILDYQAPAECASEADVRGAVARLVTKPHSEPLRAQVLIESTTTGYLSRIVAASSAERRLSGATCAEVVEATAVILALAMSPKQPPPEAPPAPVASVHEPNPTPAEPKRVDTRASRAQLEVRAGIIGDSSVLPQPAFGFFGVIGLRGDRWAAQVAGAYFLEQRTRLPSDGTRGGDLALWSVWPSACGAPVRGWWRLELCAGPELGRMLGDGFGVTVPRHPAAFWLAALGAGQLSLGLSASFRAHAALGGLVRLTPDRPFVLDGIDTVHQPARFSGRASLGWELVF
jgi:hypothetical protein